MSSAITFSGFNDIDFNLILSSIMRQESQPLVALQDKQFALQARINTFNNLSSRVSSVQTAAEALATSDSLSAYSATTTDATAVGVSTGAGAVAGRYDIVVNELARAQVTASSAVGDSDTTIVATGGTLTIGGEAIAISGPTTLKGLADAINDNADSPARAAIVQSGPGAFKLVLSGKTTGAANAFTVTDGLTAPGITFGANAVNATDASLVINNLAITSTTNTLDAAIPGATLTLLKKDSTKTIVVDVAADPSKLKDKIKTFITSYNDLVKFATDQSTLAGRGDQSSIGRDPLLRSLRNQLRTVLNDKFGAAEGYLSQMGIEFSRTGQLELDEAVFAEATKDGNAAIQAVFAGTEASPGAFKAIKTLLKEYTQANGLLLNAKTQLTQQVSRLTDQIASMQERLAVRRTALQREFTAADAAMSQLKSQSGSLASFGQSL